MKGSCNSFLHKKGGEVSYYDPYIPEVTTPKGKTFQSLNPSVLQSGDQSINPSVHQSLDPSILQSFDCVVITTNHQVFDAQMIKQDAKLIVDLRNVIKEGATNIYKL